MKHAEMLPLMGQIVTVNVELRRYRTSPTDRAWKPVAFLRPWVGWIIGFRHKLDGKVEYPKHNDDENTYFHHETGRQLCVMVAPWPTMTAKPVPLDGYELGGTPLAPDNGGWRQRKR